MLFKENDKIMLQSVKNAFVCFLDYLFIHRQSTALGILSNKSIPNTNKTDVDAFVYFIYLFSHSSYGALSEARHQKQFKFGCLVCSIALYVLWNTQRFSLTGISGTLPGIS